MKSNDVKHCWYVFYTHPRAEKVVLNELLAQGYEVFLPLFKTIKTWKNRQKKTIYSVLFPGYIFVKTVESRIYKILQFPKICTYIKCGNKPGIIQDKEIEALKLILGLEKEIVVEQDFIEGEHVRITQGALSGLRGILIMQKGKSRFAIQLNDIKQMVTIDISTSMLEKIDA